MRKELSEVESPITNRGVSANKQHHMENANNMAAMGKEEKKESRSRLVGVRLCLTSTLTNPNGVVSLIEAEIH